jgi:hypothetical protein
MNLTIGERMNVFEGARRLAAAIAAVCFLGVIAFNWSYKPYLEMHYTWGANGDPKHILGCSGLPEYRARVLSDDLNMSAIFCGSSGGQDEVVLPPAELKLATEVASDMKFAHTKTVYGYTTLALLVYWLVVIGIGWIVRGFFGIPQGRDRKLA